ncbi:MAG: hypothetical protein ACKO45_09440 [Cyanobium sp.]
MHLFTLLGAIRIAMLWFSDALEGLKRELWIGLSQITAHLGVVMRTPLLVVYALILFLLYGQLLRGRRMPRVLEL